MSDNEIVPRPNAQEAASVLESSAVANFVEQSPRQLIAARNDRELIRTFLSRGNLSATTVANTRKELERFLLWCEWKALSFRTVTVENLIEYSSFLMDPAPADVWVSTTKWPRSHPNWRPFAGPLSDASHRQAFTAIVWLFRWATDAGYLVGNPAALLGKPRAPQMSTITRYLPEAGIELAYAAAENVEATTPAAVKRKFRNIFLIKVFCSTGARLAEVTGAKMGDLRPDQEGRWKLTVLGKGNKTRHLPVDEELLSAYENYRVAYGLAPQTSRSDSTPLVLSSRLTRVIGSDEMVLTGSSNDAVQNAVKCVLAGAETLAKARGDVDLAGAIELASTHWLRHAFLTQLAKELPLEQVRDAAGHKSLATTSLYLHTDENERHDAIVNALEKRRLARERSK